MLPTPVFGFFSFAFFPKIEWIRKTWVMSQMRYDTNDRNNTKERNDF